MKYKDYVVLGDYVARMDKDDVAKGKIMLASTNIAEKHDFILVEKAG